MEWGSGTVDYDLTGYLKLSKMLHCLYEKYGYFVNGYPTARLSPLLLLPFPPRFQPLPHL